jgi:hypothetical protein
MGAPDRHAQEPMPKSSNHEVELQILAEVELPCAVGRRITRMALGHATTGHCIDLSLRQFLHLHYSSL